MHWTGAYTLAPCSPARDYVRLHVVRRNLHAVHCNISRHEDSTTKALICFCFSKRWFLSRVCSLPWGLVSVSVSHSRYLYNPGRVCAEALSGPESHFNLLLLYYFASHFNYIIIIIIIIIITKVSR